MFMLGTTRTGHVREVWHVQFTLYQFWPIPTWLWPILVTALVVLFLILRIRNRRGPAGSS